MRDHLAVPLAFLLAALVPASGLDAETLATFTIHEPLGISWSGEWLRQTVAIDRSVSVDDLALVRQGEETVPARFTPRGDGKYEILFRTDVPKREEVSFAVVEGASRQWEPLRVHRSEEGYVVANRYYRFVFDAENLRPVNTILAQASDGRGEATLLARCEWPDGVKPRGVRDSWKERGPVQVVLERTFTFAEPDLQYRITFDFRAEDPWVGVVDEYRLGAGRHLTIDLREIEADTVYHPHTYSARTFQAGGEAEDTTLEPPQHPVATLGPIWRDIWFGGGPFAFVYRSVDFAVDGDANRRDRREARREAEAASGAVGIGFAAVRGSQWDTREGITPESQNLEVHGDDEEPGEVDVQLPVDGGTRHWAVVVGEITLRHRMGRLIRSHADTPLQKVLDEWVLEWESDAPKASAGLVGQWLDYFNKHSLNPTTFPRRIQVPEGPVKSRDLAILAYQFTNPDYWPGPKYKWRIGNPNFHTDMYSIPLKIGLAMPDHPHSARWVEFGIEETRGNLMRDSYPGGAWAESLSYSEFFFDVAEFARRLQEADAAPALKEWSRIREVATWLACMHTPVDPRYGTRQKAPIGDTSPGHYIEELNRLGTYYRGIDDDFARSMERFPRPGPDAVDLSSRAFYGFGAMLRGNAYDRERESFVTIKAGPARNHYQGDELSVYFASLSTPLAIDYACHYSPRPWSASIHNRPDMNGQRPVAVGQARATRTSPVADVFVADERTWRINEVPMEPHHATKPGWNYPWRELPEDHPWTFRRYSLLVKHDPGESGLADYLVLRDEIDSPETPWWNLHLLVRDLERQAQRFRGDGQLDVNIDVHVITPHDVAHEERQWGWAAGDSGSRRRLKGEAYEERNFGAWIPGDFQPGTWRGGEMAKWLRMKGEPGRSDWLVVLMPYRKGTKPPVVRGLSDTSLRVSLGDEVETIHLGSDGKFQAAVERDGKRTVLLENDEVKSWSQVDFPGSAHRSERVDAKD